MLPLTRISTRKFVFIGPLLAVIALLVLVARWQPPTVLAAQQRNFTNLGPMPGSCQGCDTYATALSADGSTVVGSAYVCADGSTTCTSTGKTEAYRWTVANGYQLLGDLEGSFSSSPAASGSQAFAVSSDGSVVVGLGPQGSPDVNVFGAFRWTASTGMQPLPMPPLLEAYGVSADGSTIVGPFGWVNTSSGQSGTFGSFPGQTDLAQALGVSADGQIAVGFAFNGSNATGPTYNVLRWTLASGLGVPGVNSDADAISTDGTTIVGEYQTEVNGPYTAFRWTASNRMVNLGNLGGPGSRALAVNQDGTVIVGASLPSQESTSSHAFRWTAATGMQDLNKLVSEFLVLTSANGISPDGKVIAGNGLAKFGKFRSQNQPFVAVVPLP